MLAAGENHAAERYLVHGSNGFADHGIGVVADFAVGDDVVRPNQVQVIDLAARNKLVDLNGAGRLHRDIFELVLADLKVPVGIDLVALDNVLGGDLIAGVSVDLLHLIRWPVFLLIRLKLIFSDSDVAGKRAIGQVTRVN